MNNTGTILHYEHFNNLTNWSVAGAISQSISFNKKYKLVPIGQFLIRNRNVIDIDDETLYTQITLKINNGGVVERGQKKGIEIGTKKQIVVRKGQFIFSKIDARNGAFGIIPEELDGAIVTNDFPVFDIDQSIINPTFLLLVTTTKAFVKFAQSCSSGTTNRQRIDIDAFLQQQIPLPSISDQKVIIDRYNCSISEAKNYEYRLSQIEKDINTYILNALSCVSDNNKKILDYDKKDGYKYLQFTRLESLSRWDLYNERKIHKSNCYKNIKLSTVVVSKPQYGASYSSIPYDGKTIYIRITDINEDGSLSESVVSAKGYSDNYLLKEDDFLIARSGNTVGKTFLYNEKMGKAIYAGYLIRFELDKTQIIPEYLLAYTKSSIYKEWIQSNMRVSAQPNINSQQYMDSPIIIPPIDIQGKIVAYVKKQKILSIQLKKNAQKKRENALKVFENEIFDNNNCETY